MKLYNLLVLFLMFSSAVLAAPKLLLNVTLSPAGSFTALSKKPKGEIVKKGDVFTADKLTVSIDTFSTENDLRDKHFKEHLHMDKHPKAIVTELKAQDGKGTANLEVNGIVKPITVSYLEKGQEVEAKFSVKNSDFNLSKANYLGVGVEDEINVEVTMPFITK